MFTGVLAAWFHCTLRTQPAALFRQETAEVYGPKAGCGAPNVEEEGGGELTGHTQHRRKSAAECAEVVADHEADVEALKGVFPHAVERVNGVWLGNDVLKVDLETKKANGSIRKGWSL